MTPEEVMARFGTLVWYEKPRGRDFAFKTLKVFVKEVKEKCNQ